MTAKKPQHSDGQTAAHSKEHVHESLYRERVVPFTATDGVPLRLTNIRGDHEPTRAPVLLVHGAGVRSNIFRAPVKRTVVDALITEGYDVWLLDWRASILLAEREWTLDQAAAFDHPAAVQTVVRETGKDQIKAIVHCQGSTSFMMSAVAGLVPQVSTIISNAVSLHPVVPTGSRFKLDLLVPGMSLLTRWMNPHWGVKARGFIPRLVAWLSNVTHRECENRVCKLVSFVYGFGKPALWSHETISEKTHEWLKEEFGAVPLRFHRQMARCVRAGHLVGVENLAGLPRNFVAEPPRTDARFSFFAGAENLCFLPESQERTHAYMNKLKPDFHTLHVLPRLGHLDVFMGDDAARDAFPLMLAELERGNENTGRS